MHVAINILTSCQVIVVSQRVAVSKADGIVQMKVCISIFDKKLHQKCSLERKEKGTFIVHVKIYKHGISTFY